MELENLPLRLGYYVFLFEIPGLVFIGICCSPTTFCFRFSPARSSCLSEVDGASGKLFRYSSPEPGVRCFNPSFIFSLLLILMYILRVYSSNLSLTSLFPSHVRKGRSVSPRPYSFRPSSHSIHSSFFLLCSTSVFCFIERFSLWFWVCSQGREKEFRNPSMV